MDFFDALYFCYKFNLTYRLKYDTIAYMETGCNYINIIYITVLIWFLGFMVNYGNKFTFQWKRKPTTAAGEVSEPHLRVYM